MICGHTVRAAESGPGSAAQIRSVLPGSTAPRAPPQPATYPERVRGPSPGKTPPATFGCLVVTTRAVTSMTCGRTTSPLDSGPGSVVQTARTPMAPTVPWARLPPATYHPLRPTVPPGSTSPATCGSLAEITPVMT